MTTYIADGTGSNRLARVDTEFKLRTSAVTETEFVHASELGDAYGVNSKLTVLTDDVTESAVFYLKNNETRNIVIEALEVTHQASVGGTNGAAYRVYRNVTGGSIVTNAVAGASRNYNYGSSNVLSADVYMGGQGETIVGEPALGFFFDGTVAFSQIFPLSGLIISPAQTIGITCIPPSGNTSFVMAIGFRCFMKVEGTSL